MNYLLFPWLIFVVAIIGCNRDLSVNADTNAASRSTTMSIPSQIVRSRIPLQSQQQQNRQHQQQIWLYEGALYDPLDGRQVAKVQGLELVRPLENTTHLAIDSLLRHPNATFDDAKTLWSQKVFCYTKTSTTTTAAAKRNDDDSAFDDDESILRSVRVRPQSPRKEVPLDQAVAVYETATTFISRGDPHSRRRRRRNNKKDGMQQQQNENENDEILVHSEFPNGQTMWGTAQDCRRQKYPLGIDFTIFAKLRNRHSPLYAPDLIESDDDDDEDDVHRQKSRKGDGGDVIISPKRSALIQFGSSSRTMESKHKFGARETYSYRNTPSTTIEDTDDNNNSRWFPWKMKFPKNKKKKNDDRTTSTASSLYYTRYGEGPPFYAPGRMCMLELQARPISDLKEATPILQGLLQKDGPVANFHWNNKDDEVISSSSTVDSSTVSRRKEPNAPPSIQTAWNLKESRKYADGGTRSFSSKTSATTTSKRRSLTTTSSKHLLRLRAQADNDFNMDDTGAGRHFRAWTRRGKRHAVALWDRVRASTMMEAGSST